MSGAEKMGGHTDRQILSIIYTDNSLKTKFEFINADKKFEAFE
jgi:hypothetical protein